MTDPTKPENNLDFLHDEGYARPFDTRALDHGTMIFTGGRKRESLDGTWTFTPDSPAGKGIPAVVFTPSTPDASSLRILLVVDGRLDDGDGAKGIFRVSETEAAFTLKAE